MTARNRIKELRWVAAGSLVPHELNWRKHGDAQKSALAAMLAEVGWTDSLIARELDDGRLQILDGHLRQGISGEEQVPVLVLDVTEEEGRKVLLSHDPIAAMAEADRDTLRALLAHTTFDDASLLEMIEALRTEHLAFDVPQPGSPVGDATLAHPVPQPEDASIDAPTSGVRMVNLYFDEDTHREFVAKEGQLRGALGTLNATETVLALVRQASMDIK